MDVLALRMLIERLNWPVRMVRLLAAKQFGELLGSADHGRDALGVYLDWLANRTLESQVVSGLAVLLATAVQSRPAFGLVARHIQRPSILADFILERLYGPGRGTGRWRSAHSGVAPPAFTPEPYFLNHKTAHVPPILDSRFEQLEGETGFPFLRQWAYEWRQLMDATQSPYSEFPHYFANVLLTRSGILGQFSTRQCDVYRSAFLRTLSCAVDEWGIPVLDAAYHSTLSFPANCGLLDLEPAQRPEWLSDLPEKCCEVDAPLRVLGKELLTAGSLPSEALVSLKVPTASATTQYAELSLVALMVSEDFQPSADQQGGYRKLFLWPLRDGVTFAGTVDLENIEDYTSEAARGSWAPVCTDVWPLPSGFWHNDVLHSGITAPAPYLFRERPLLKCDANSLNASIHGTRVASSQFWLDHWTPLYPPDGHTRCGVATRLSDPYLREALERHRRELGWAIEVRTWQAPTEYAPLELTQRREFFRN